MLLTLYEDIYMFTLPIFCLGFSYLHSWERLFFSFSLFIILCLSNVIKPMFASWSLWDFFFKLINFSITIYSPYTVFHLHQPTPPTCDCHTVFYSFYLFLNLYKGYVKIRIESFIRWMLPSQSGIFLAGRYWLYSTSLISSGLLRIYMCVYM